MPPDRDHIRPVAVVLGVKADPIDRAMDNSIHDAATITGKIMASEFVENEGILTVFQAIGVD